MKVHELFLGLNGRERNDSRCNCKPLRTQSIKVFKQRRFILIDSANSWIINARLLFLQIA